MASHPLRCAPSNVPEESVGLLESPEKEVPLAKCLQECEASDEGFMSQWAAPARSELLASTVADVVIQESTDLSCVQACNVQLNEISQIDPESKAPHDICDPADKLLQDLAEFTNMQTLAGPTLSVEFQMMLQLLECSAQQQKLLQQVNDRVEYMHSELAQRVGNLASKNSLTAQTFETEDSLQAHQNEACDALFHGVINGSTFIVEAEKQMDVTSSHQESNDTEVTPTPRTINAAQEDVDAELACELTGFEAVHRDSLFGHRFRSAEKPLPTVVGEKGSKRSSEFTILDDLHTMSKILAEEAMEEPKFGLLGQIATSSYFDLLCAIVITTNAATIGIQAQFDIEWALSNMEVPAELPRNSIVFVMDKVYIAFYIFELALKLIVWRCAYFSGEDKKWNIFDMILVIAGIYDLIMEVTPLSFSGEGGHDFEVTWLRFMRMLKMLKLLRVVRVMRFFQQLRLMVSSIASSISTLLWSMLMLSMIMYTFALCFIQAISSHLTEDLHVGKDGDVDDTRTGIEEYWSSVFAAMTSLYFAITGGADWEQLAAPIEVSDPIFYGVFCVYITFMTIAVLNVLTGMFVDQAMKVANEDEINVMKELASKPEVHHFREFIKLLSVQMEREVDQLLPISETGEGEEEEEKEKGAPDEKVVLTWSMLNQHLHLDIVNKFFNSIEITEEDGIRVFRMLDPESSEEVDLEDFIRGCLAANTNAVSSNVVFLVAETKRLAQQLTVSMVYMEERFDELWDGIHVSGPALAKEGRLSLRSKLNTALSSPVNQVQRVEKKQWESIRRASQRQSLRTAVKSAGVDLREA